APPAENVMLHQRLAHALGLDFIGNTGKEALTSVRGFNAAGFLFTVERQNKRAEAGIPECFIELSLERQGFLLPCGGLSVSVEHFGQVGSLPVGVINIPLYFTQGDGRFGKPPVLIKNTIMRIFPSLVGEAGLHTYLVLDESIFIDVTVFFNPPYGPFDIGPYFHDGFIVGRSFIIVSGQRYEQGSSVDGAIILAEGDFVQGGHFPTPRLMQYLSGLCVAEGI